MEWEELFLLQATVCDLSSAEGGVTPGEETCSFFTAMQTAAVPLDAQTLSLSLSSTSWFASATPPISSSPQ